MTSLATFRRLGVESMTGAAGQQRVSPDFVANFVAPIPPRDEQVEILKFIHVQTSRLSEAIRQANREISLTQEYRTRLITDVVTGKLDMRQLAPAVGEPLPDDAEPLDEGAPLAEDGMEKGEDLEAVDAGSDDES